jgi:hypothetical protein
MSRSRLAVLLVTATALTAMAGCSSKTSPAPQAADGKPAVQAQTDTVFVPQARKIQIDGKLDDWKASGRLPLNYLTRATDTFEPTLYVSWSTEGLYLAGRIPVAQVAGGQGDTFWESPNIELFVDASNDPSRVGWPTGSHQFWLMPVDSNGTLVGYAGEYKRNDSIADTIFDDKRIKTAVTTEKNAIVLEAFIPAEALGGKPAVGQTWRAGLAVQDKAPMNASWPKPKLDGLLDGVQMWGKFTFVGK